MLKQLTLAMLLLANTTAAESRTCPNTIVGGVLEEGKTYTVQASEYGGVGDIACYPQADGSCIYLNADGSRFHASTTETIAHRNLPFGTVIDLFNPDSDTTHRVKVADDGPHYGVRQVDLPVGVADVLKFDGLGEIRMTIIDIPDNGNCRD